MRNTSTIQMRIKLSDWKLIDLPEILPKALHIVRPLFPHCLGTALLLSVKHEADSLLLLSAELRCYFVSQCEFEHPDADETEGDLRLVSAKQFLDKVCCASSIAKIHYFCAEYADR
jgi:hypothetical protein